MQERIDAVKRMQDYIEKHLCETITLADLSRASMFSPWYSHKLFAFHTGLPPADYIRRLRLSRSALILRDENVRIADVAFEMGFGSVDGYQRAFLREFGCNPREYARNPVPLPLFTPFKVRASIIEKEESMEEVRSVFIQLIDKPSRKAIIKRGVKAEDYMEYCGEVGCDVWGILKSMKSLCGEPVCMWLPLQYRKPGTSEYVQGVEVAPDYDGPIPEGFDIIELPEAKYMLFRGEPFEEENYMRAIGDLWRAMERFDPKPVGWQWDENSPRIQLEPIGERGYMELKAVKPL